MECANKRKMSVGSWPYWREVGKRGAIRDRLDIARFLSEFISEGKSFASSLRSTVEPSREKERRKGEKKKKKIISKRILNFTIACATVSLRGKR